MNKVIVCYANTGGGHKQAAEAVRDALIEVHNLSEQTGPLEVITQGALQSDNFINSMFLDFYNYLLRDHQQWMKHYYTFIEWLKPNESRLAYKMCGSYAKDMWTRLQPAVVVSVHPMLNHYTYLGLADAGLAGKTKLVVVVTDPNAGLWSGWACKDADLIIAPNDLARDRLIEMGTDPQRVRAIGMPVNPAFLKPPLVTRQELLKQLKLKLETGRLTILLSGGWAGGGEVLQMYRSLQRVKKPIQVVTLCGHNQRLRAALETEAKRSNLPTAVLPFVDSMPDLMAACDLIITKGGGLTTAESVARRLPMVLDMLTAPMPQEIGTVNILVEANLAIPLKHIAELPEIIENFQPVVSRESQLLPTVHNLHRTDAVYDIARDILALIEPAGSLKPPRAMAP